MEDKDNNLNSSPEFIDVIEGIMAQQMALECQFEGLLYVFQAMLKQINPSQIEAMDRGYRNIVLKVFDKKKTLGLAYSPTMTDKIDSLLKEIPGIKLPDL